MISSEILVLLHDAWYFRRLLQIGHRLLTLLVRAWRFFVLLGDVLLVDTFMHGAVVFARERLVTIPTFKFFDLLLLTVLLLQIIRAHHIFGVAT